MKRNAVLPELLAPAGSYDALLAAVDAGADAVYLGGRTMNARAFARNFDDEEMARAIEYCHLHGVRVYVTLNTALTTRELGGALDYAALLYGMGVDAVIVADLGLISLLRSALPALEIHASTQASVHSAAGADLLARTLGVQRVVLARELPLGEIRTVTEACRPEIEVFLHGALCVSHSGQCLFSSLVGGRSGNRGACAQPCRLPYNGGHPLSLRDLCLAEHIPALIASGVSSLKIEGRMKSPAYVHGVTRIYRRLLDEGRAASKSEMQELALLFSRDGFTDGYFTGRPGDKMTGIRREEDKMGSRELAPLSIAPRSAPLCASCVILHGLPSRLTLRFGEYSATVTGQTPAPALSSPMTRESVAARLRKLGGTGFSLGEEALELALDPGLNLSPAALNELRRRAVDALRDAMKREIPHFAAPSPRSLLPRSPRLSLAFRTAEQMHAIPKEMLARFDEISLPITALPASGRMPNAVSLPPVLFSGEERDIRARLASLVGSGVERVLISGAGQLEMVRELGFTPIGDFRLNITNAASAALWSEAGLADAILSPELPPALAGKLGGRVITMGRVPLMLLERCFMRENFGCDACGAAALTDRRRVKFPLLREYPHRNLLVNSLPTYMGDKRDELRRYGITGEHLLFTVESPAECRAMLQAYLSGAPLTAEHRRLPKQY